MAIEKVEHCCTDFRASIGDELSLKISNRLPSRKASVTVSRTQEGGALNVHGGAPRNTEFPPELGPQVFGRQLVTKVPVPKNENSNHGQPMAIEPVRLNGAGRKETRQLETH